MKLQDEILSGQEAKSIDVSVNDFDWGKKPFKLNCSEECALMVILHKDLVNGETEPILYNFSYGDNAPTLGKIVNSASNTLTGTTAGELNAFR